MTSSAWEDSPFTPTARERTRLGAAETPNPTPRKEVGQSSLSNQRPFSFRREPMSVAHRSSGETVGSELEVDYLLEQVRFVLELEPCDSVGRYKDQEAVGPGPVFNPWRDNAPDTRPPLRSGKKRLHREATGSRSAALLRRAGQFDHSHPSVAKNPGSEKEPPVDSTGDVTLKFLHHVRRTTDG